MRCHTAIGLWPTLTAGLLGLLVFYTPAGAVEEPPHSAELDAMIIKQAKRHGVPERLVRRVVMRESRYNPRARNHSYWGLMQISYPTAKSMGFKGTPEDLLNPITNLTYAVPYLANAFAAAGKREDEAVRLYAHGYYDAARRKGLLGVLRTATSTPVTGVIEEPTTAASVAAAEPDYGIFGALVSPIAGPSTTHVASAEAGNDPAAPRAPEPRAVTAASGPGGKITDAVDMVATKGGAAEPPKKWRRDGGVTILARGEQSAESEAGYAALQSGKTVSGQIASRRSRKNTQFAALDMSPSSTNAAPSSAQAYALSATGVETAPPQSAIAQAITPVSQQFTADATRSSVGADDVKSADGIEPTAAKPKRKLHKSRAVTKSAASAPSSVAEVRQ